MSSREYNTNSVNKRKYYNMLSAKEIEAIGASLKGLSETELDDFSNKVCIDNNKSVEKAVDMSMIEKALENMSDIELEKFCEIFDKTCVANNDI